MVNSLEASKWPQRQLIAAALDLQDVVDERHRSFPVIASARVLGIPASRFPAPGEILRLFHIQPPSRVRRTMAKSGPVITTSPPISSNNLSTVK